MKNNNNLKEQVKDKAAELFFKYGPKHVSVDEIAEAAGISKKTLYKLYPGKTDIVNEVVDSLIQLHNNLFKTVKLTSSNAIEEVLKQDAGLTLICKSVRPSFFYEVEMYFPDAWKKLEDYKLKVNGGIENNLHRDKTELLYREDLNIPLISDLRLQQVANLLRPHILTNLSLNTKELVDEFTLLYLHAISTENGRIQLQTYIEEQN